MMQSVGKNGLNRKVWCEMPRYIDAYAFEVVSLKDVSDEFAEGVQFMLEQLDKAPTIEARPVVRVAARPLEEWDEDYGDVLWWKFPIEEPPYVGSPLDCNWSGYHTHWTPIEVPEPPNCGADMRGGAANE